MSVRLTVRVTVLRRFAGEITQQMIKNKKAPGSLNGSGLFQTIVSLKIREVYEKITVSRGEAHLGSKTGDGLPLWASTLLTFLFCDLNDRGRRWRPGSPLRLKEQSGHCL